MSNQEGSRRAGDFGEHPRSDEASNRFATQRPAVAHFTPAQLERARRAERRRIERGCRGYWQRVCGDAAERSTRGW